MTVAVDWEEMLNDEAERQKTSTELAWRTWLMSLCAEFNGGHDIRLVLDMGSWSIRCDYGCPVELDDYMPDGYELTCADIPILVEVETFHHKANPNHGDEWDVSVCLRSRK